MYLLFERGHLPLSTDHLLQFWRLLLCQNSAFSWLWFYDSTMLKLKSKGTIPRKWLNFMDPFLKVIQATKEVCKTSTVSASHPHSRWLLEAQMLWSNNAIADFLRYLRYPQGMISMTWDLKEIHDLLDWQLKVRQAALSISCLDNRTELRLLEISNKLWNGFLLGWLRRIVLIWRWLNSFLSQY